MEDNNTNIVVSKSSLTDNNEPSEESPLKENQTESRKNSVSSNNQKTKISKKAVLITVLVISILAIIATIVGVIVSSTCEIPINDANQCLVDDEGPCGELEICKNIPGGFECTNLEDQFENGDPNKLVISSTYPMEPESSLELPILFPEFNFNIGLKPQNATLLRRRRSVTKSFKKSESAGELLTVSGASRTIIAVTQKTPDVVEVQIADLETCEIPIIYPKKYNEIDITQTKRGDGYVDIVTLNGVEHCEEQNENVTSVEDVTISTGDQVQQANVVNARELNTAICGNGYFIDNLWLVDGTGSYKGNIPVAKAEFKKNRDFLKDKKEPTRLGLSFFADRDHNFGTAMNTLYSHVLPLTDVNLISDSQIDAAFEKISTLGGGGDSPEDVLLGLDFSVDPDMVQWEVTSKVKLVSVFSDNPFHYAFDSADKGTVVPPLRAWFTPQPQYRYHVPEEISKLLDQIGGEVFGNIPFSLDFYITASTSSVLDQYKKYFMLDDTIGSEWFVMRKMFQSSAISDSFTEKIKNLNSVLERADYINNIFEEKCVGKQFEDRTD